MRNPSIWVIIGYILAAPLAAAVTKCVLSHGYGELKKDQIRTACILGFGMLVSVIKGMDGVLNMFPLSIPIFLFGVLCSAYFAVECVQKRDAEKLGIGHVVSAVGCYFMFLVFTVLAAPQLRWCEGCLEWH